MINKNVKEPTEAEIRQVLKDRMGDESGTVITYPAYAGAFVGITFDNRPIYDFFRMIMIQAVDRKIDIVAAQKIVESDIVDMETVLNAAGDNPPIIFRGNPFAVDA
ncbi:hypothetical protein J6A31_04725 [bacterium]|nr:hypothetical protein [bacterium]